MKTRIFKIVFALPILIGMNFFAVYAQTDSSGCGIRIILPAPAETCQNNNDFKLKGSATWFEFTANGTDAAVITAPSQTVPSASITKISLFEGPCSNLRLIKSTPINDTLTYMEVSGLVSGKKYKIKVEGVGEGGNFLMCLKRLDRGGRGASCPGATPQWDLVTGSTTDIFNCAGGMVGIGLTQHGSSFIDFYTKLDVLGTVSTKSIIGYGWTLGPAPGGPNNRVTLGYRQPFGWSAILETNGQLTVIHTPTEFFNSIGIGTAPSSQYKLDVCGTIRSKEWIVETGWCDFVFEPDYQLQSFKERLDWITKNRRLPYMLSADEIETNGAPMGQLFTGLVRNTEELYLYMDRLEKRTATLEKENMFWKKKYEELEIRIKALENK